MPTCCVSTASGAAGSFECDLTSLESVQGFVKAWGAAPIDVLCLNAGLAPNTRDPTPRCDAEQDSASDQRCQDRADSGRGAPAAGERWLVRWWW